MTGRTIAVTGCNGFIGKNLAIRLTEGGHQVAGIGSSSDVENWRAAIEACDAVVHLAGANRPEDPSDFERINSGSTQRLLDTLNAAGKVVPIVYASSIRAAGDDPYGCSKRAAEELLLEYGRRTNAGVAVFRLPNVFGKWARPNYNSAIATFCYNVARAMPIVIHDPDVPLRLVYIDDVVDAFLVALDGETAVGFREAGPVYETTVGRVANIIRGFRIDRDENLIDAVGTGLIRALYATYVSTLPTSEFSYPITSHRDARGAFSEMLKTRSCGQFSYFTALPRVTRGGHYHHTKTEKFLIVHGTAKFRFRHLLTGEVHEIETSGDEPVVVETIPGWAHDVTNTGDGMMVSLLWANEIFDRARPDTIAAGV